MKNTYLFIDFYCLYMEKVVMQFEENNKISKKKNIFANVKQK